VTDFHDRSRAASAARLLLEQPTLVDLLVRTEGVVADPIEIVTPEANEFIGWFVPVVTGDRLVGFFVLEPDLFLRRWSTFQWHRDTLDGCPPASDWLDRSLIAQRALAAADGTAGAGHPVLSFEHVPDRIAWLVPVGDRRVYVAGTAAWVS